MKNLYSFIKNNLSKSEINSIPYWDRVRMTQIDSTPENTEMSHKHLRVRGIDKDHYQITQLAIGSNGKYIKYEMVLVTIHHYDFGDGRKGTYKTYHLVKEVWFY